MTGDRDEARQAEARDAQGTKGPLAAIDEPAEPPPGTPETSRGPAEGALAIAKAALEAGQDVVARPVEETISVAKAALGRAGRALGGDAASRTRRVRRQGKKPLALLYEEHPDARRALPHPLGLRTIPLSEIAGSAVEPAQRGGDFLPIPAMRDANWAARWQRLRTANERLAHFPPIDAIRFADRYWVSDGHNRVALALYEGQPEIDANVTELHLPGERTQPAGSLVPLLEASRETATSFRTSNAPRDREVEE